MVTVTATTLRHSSKPAVKRARTVTSAFFLKWSDVPVGAKACADADGFDFKPPQDASNDDNRTVQFAFSVCGDAVQVSQMLSPSVGF
jgi:hypothetical protein